LQELSLLRFLAARGFSMSAARQAVAQALGKN
jgi:SOS response regulatory protein OraA/RecX